MSALEYQLTIRLDNAAFEDDVSAELARILNALADRALETGIGASETEWNNAVRDYNGNAVGRYRIKRIAR